MTNATNKKHPQIGDVYFMFFEGNENEQTGWRPGLVFQNNVGNKHSPNIIALPITSQIKKTNQPTHVLISAVDTGMKRDSMILCENPERMSKKKIGKYITTLSDEYMAKVAAANLLSSSAIAYIDQETLLALWHKAISLNSQEITT